MRRLRGRTFGVIGLGRIGTATALRAKAFGMNVIAYDPYVSRGAEIALGVDRTDRLESLLSVSDAVSLHCPLTDETRGMINATTLAAMNAHAILINTARGAIVDIPALVQALRDGVIAGAGIDVLPVEPPSADDAIALAYRTANDPIVGERLIVTPHAAWSSPESVADARRLAVRDRHAIFARGPAPESREQPVERTPQRIDLKATVSPEPQFDFPPIRFHNHRRRLGGMHPRQPAQRIRPSFGAGARGRRQG